MADLVESMMSANKEIPWHGKGNILDGYPTVAEAYEASGLDWQVMQYPLQAITPNGAVDLPQYALMRDKDNQFFGTCSDAYQVFQNKEAFDWCSPLLDSGEWKMETAGALKNGKTCWVLLNQGTVSILKNDKLKQYLLMTWSHDGKTAIRLGCTSVRVVCNNTLTQALNTDSETLLKIAHNTAMPLRLDEAYKLYSTTAGMFNKQTELFGMLADHDAVSKEVKQDLIDVAVQEAHRVLDDDDLEDMSERRKRSMQRTAQEIDWFINNSLGQKELKIQSNLWGIYNGIEAWVEKARFGKRITDRGNDILFGRGKEICDKVFEAACAAC